MFIRMMSDLHLEFGPLDLPVIDGEGRMVLILAGDIGVAEKLSTLIPFLLAMAGRHMYVLVILGNHEHYHGSFVRSKEKIVAELAKHGVDNIHIMEKDVFVVDDVAFLGATMWTDFNKGNPHTMFTVEQGLNDYRIIRNGPVGEPYRRKLRAMDTAIVHRDTVEWLFPEIVKHKAEGRKVVVFTHHAPSTLSIADEYKDDIHFNGGYASALEFKILDTSPNVWIHGHTHTTFDYMLGDTRIICNPRGYTPRDLNPTFDPNKVIEV